MNTETGGDTADMSTAAISGDGFSDESGQHLRILEALLFAADEPMDRQSLLEKLPDGAEIDTLMARLAERYTGRGVNLVAVGNGWAFRTAPDLASHLTVHRTVKRRLSRAALETLAIISYHQPATRAEVEEIRGVALSRGTLDQLLEAGWVKPKGRRRTPGRPLTWVTTDEFLNHFGLDNLADLPGVEELKAAGLLQAHHIALGGADELPFEAAPDDDEDDADSNDDYDSIDDNDVPDSFLGVVENAPLPAEEGADDTDERDEPVAD